MSRIISISLNPNLGREELAVCGKMLMGLTRTEGVGKKLAEMIEGYYKRKVAVVESGRVGLYLLLKAWGVGEGDEVIIQAFTCSVVPAAIRAVGAMAVYVDVDKNYNLDLEKLGAKINPKTKAVIVQHTFGKPVNMEKLRRIVPKGVKILEDLAHGLGNSYRNKKLGLWGDGAVLSFGRDKVISGINGGAVVAGREVIDQIEKLESGWLVRDEVWTVKRLMYPLWIGVVVNLYNVVGIGRGLHWGLRKLGILPEVISREEKSGQSGERYRGLPDDLANLVLVQWRKLEVIIGKRKEAAIFYAKELRGKFDNSCSYLRYPIMVDEPDELRRFAAKRGVFLGDWYDRVVAPKSVKVADFGYEEGVAPRAEKLVRRVVNLPTCPSLSSRDLKRVVSIIKEWKSKK